MPELFGAGKIAAATAAVGRVRKGMRLAIGSGTTVAMALDALRTAFPGGIGVEIVVASEGTAAEARELGLNPGPLLPDAHFDLMLDGADEVTPALALTKGGGGALFREKFLGRLSDELVIMVDTTKLVDRLGTRHPIPIEVVPFARPVLSREIGALGFDVSVRTSPESGRAWRTDNGNEILDLKPHAPIDDPAELDRSLHALPGVVETGIFIGLAHRVLVGQPDGSVREMERPAPP
jgi:ribose 5-phosphate isomerase A